MRVPPEIFIYTGHIGNVNSAAKYIHSLEFHEIHDIFAVPLRTKGCSTIHDIKLPPHPLALHDRFNPIDFKSPAQRNTMNCEDVTKRTFQNIEIKWSIAGHLMNYLRAKLNLGGQHTRNFVQDILSLFPSPFMLNFLKLFNVSSYISQSRD